VFRTNQATDDHVRDDAGSDWEAYSSWRITADVVTEPSTRAGGHVFVPLESLDGRPFVGAAYEPTKEFRHPVRRLRAGDRVVATGSFGSSCDTLALEKLAVLEALPEFRRVKPRCEACGGAMRSKGQAAGFRCRRCGKRAPADATSHATVLRDDLVGAYEVPVCARRHLAKPLSRVVPTPDGERAPLDAVAT
jgi:tRNA(Ile2)-agmatinylcytidine synthase